MTKQDLLEALIISQITGSITEEEKPVLEEMLQESEDARKLFEEMSNVLSVEKIEAIREMHDQGPALPWIPPWCH